MFWCEPNLVTMLRHVPTLHKGMLAWCWDKIPPHPSNIPQCKLCTPGILINRALMWSPGFEDYCAEFYFGERVKLILSFFPRDNLYREFRSVKLGPNSEWGCGNIHKQQAGLSHSSCLGVKGEWWRWNHIWKDNIPCLNKIYLYSAKEFQVLLPSSIWNKCDGDLSVISGQSLVSPSLALKMEKVARGWKKQKNIVIHAFSETSETF